jgi:acyl dehydratase
VPEDASAGVNYGLDKVRFMAPVKAGARVRSRVTLVSVERKDGGRIIVKTMNELQIEGEDKPALIAETLAMLVVEAPSFKSRKEMSEEQQHGGKH